MKKKPSGKTKKLKPAPKPAPKPRNAAQAKPDRLPAKSTAKSTAKKEVKPAPNNGKIIWKLPVHVDTGISTTQTWWTECGRYCVQRSISNVGMHPRFMVGYKRHVVRHDRTEYTMLDALRDPDRGGNYPQEFKRLKDALEAAEILHKRRTLVDDVSSNLEEALSDAKDLANLPCLEVDLPNSKSESKSNKFGKENSSLKRGRSPRGGKTIVGEIIACLSKPVTLMSILERLMVEFPNHNKESMGRSIPWYINNLKKKKEMKIEKLNDGCYHLEN